MLSKILFVFDYDPFCLGGAEGNTRGLMRVLRRKSIEPFLAFPKEKSSQSDISLNLIPIGGIGETRNILDSFEVIIIQASPACRPLFLTASEYLIAGNRHFFLYFRSTTSRLPFARNLFNLSGLERSFLWERFLNILKAPQVTLIANSNTTRDDLLRFDLGSKKVKVVYSSPDWDNSPKVDSRRIVAKEFPRNRFTFLAISSDLSWMKGTPFVLQALYLLLKDPEVVVSVFNQNVFLNIIGATTGCEDLVSLVKSLDIDRNVCFVGRVDNGLVFSYLQRANCLVHASLTEALGLVLIEALGMGVPVIATNFEGMAEVLDGGRCGLLFERANAFDLKEKMKMILQPDVYRQFTQPEISRMIRAQFNLEKQAEELINLIQVGVAREERFFDSYL